MAGAGRTRGPLVFVDQKPANEVDRLARDRIAGPVHDGRPRSVVIRLQAAGKRLRTQRESRLTSLSERKTGVKHAQVVTAQLVRDERGWLWLAC